MSKHLHSLTLVMASLFAAGVTPAIAGVTGNSFEGEVSLIPEGGNESDAVFYDWFITFNNDGSLDLNASGYIQDGSFHEPIDTGFLSLFYASMDTPYESKFIGVCLASKLCVLVFFTDNDGNSLDKGKLMLVPARKPAARSKSR
jgi:hypothetical protein